MAALVAVLVTLAAPARAAAAPQCSTGAGPTTTVRAGGTQQFHLSCHDDSGPLAVVIDTSGTRGTLTVPDTGPGAPPVPAGTRTYTAPGTVGPDSFSISATDGVETSTPLTVNLDVQDASYNTAPHCMSTLTGQEPGVRVGGSRSVYLSCYDPEGDPMTMSIDQSGLRGTLAETPQPSSWTYTAPATIGDGTDSFQFTATDDRGDESATAILTLTVHDTGYTTAPQCYGSSFGAPIDLRAGGTRRLHLNCFDADNDPLTVSIDRSALRGTVTKSVSEHGEPVDAYSYTYTAPATVGDGTDSFQFTATDDRNATSAPATINIAVHDESYNTAPQCYAGPPAGVRVGGTQYFYPSCVDVDGDPIEVTIDQSGLRGTLTQPYAEMYRYTAPATVGDGTDSFQFTATDDRLATSTPVTKNFVVHGEDYTTAPQCTGTETGAEQVRVGGTRALRLSCFDAEGDPMTVSLNRSGLRGTLTQQYPEDELSWVYHAPATVGDGTDSFQFTATDDRNATSTPVTVNLTIRDQDYNTAPHCYDDYPAAPSVEAGATTTIGVSCTDAENDALTVVITTKPAHGILTAHRETHGPYTSSYLRYNSTEDAFQGTETIAYKVTDAPPTGSPSSSNIVTTSIEVTEPAAPICEQPEAVVLRAGRERGLGLECWSADQNSQAPRTFQITHAPTHGTLSALGDRDLGYVVYTPAPGFSGTDSFTYTVSNAGGTSSEMTQQLTVTAGENVAPQCYADVPWSSIRSGDTKQLSLSCWDEDGDPLTYSIVDGPAHGTLGTVQQPVGAVGSASVSYTSAAGFAGTETFTFEANDGKQDADVVTMSFEVAGAQTNTAPECWDGSSLRLAANGTVAFSSELLPCWDADGDPLTYTVITAPEHGALSAPNSGGARTYRPTNTVWTGNDTFTVKANDGRADSATVTVKLTVTHAAEFETASVTLPSGQPAKVQTYVDDAGKSTVAVTSGDVAQFENRCMPLDVGTDISAGSEGGSVTNVKLVLDPSDGSANQFFTMTNGGSGEHWTTTITCVESGDLTVTWDFTESGSTDTFSKPLGGIVLIDPAGVVYDADRFDAAKAAGKTDTQARTAAAIAGATVSLQRKTSGTWAKVPSGDPGISPNVNPQVTKTDGLYQWDASAGTYRVVVTRSGYVKTTSDEVTIPPEVTDLHVAMEHTPAAPGPDNPPPPPTDSGPVDPDPDPGTGGPVVTPPPTGPGAPATASTTPLACSTLAKAKQAACDRDTKLDAALAKCATLKGAKKTTCTQKANTAGKLATALAKCSALKGAKKTKCAKQAKAVSKCDPLKGRKKTTCVAKAKAIGRKH